MAERDALYRRVDGSTNYRHTDPHAVSPSDWHENGVSGGKLLVWLTIPEESFRYELSGPEVNELAGRVVVEEPHSAPNHEGGPMSRSNDGLRFTLLTFVGEACTPASGWVESEDILQRFAIAEGYLHTFGFDDLLIIGAHPDQRMFILGVTPRELLKKGPDRSFIEQLVQGGYLKGSAVDGTLPS